MHHLIAWQAPVSRAEQAAKAVRTVVETTHVRQFDTVHTQLVDTVHRQVIDTLGVVLSSPTPAWVTALQVLASIATVATIPAAVAAWKAAAAARDSAKAASQQASISADEWKAQREETQARQRSIDARLVKYAGIVRQRVELLRSEIATVKEAKNNRMGWLRGFNEELRVVEPMMSDLVIRAHGASLDLEETAMEAYRLFGNAIAGVGLAVRLTSELLANHEPQGSQAVHLALAMYPEHLQNCEVALARLAHTSSATTDKPL